MNLVKIVVTCCAFIFLSCTEENSIDNVDAQLAEQFRIAINVNDINTLTDMIQLPFTVNEQLWTTATDGYGFVLGERKITRIDKKDELIKFLRVFVPGVGIEGEQANFVSPAEYDHFKIELADSIDDWRNLKTYHFLRGYGDVEHIVLLGIQARSHKVKMMYLN